eukprot:7381871-Prymnesium_polylepis.1
MQTARSSSVSPPPPSAAACPPAKLSSLARQRRLRPSSAPPPSTRQSANRCPLHTARSSTVSSSCSRGGRRAPTVEADADSTRLSAHPTIVASSAWSARHASASAAVAPPAAPGGWSAAALVVRQLQSSERSLSAATPHFWRSPCCPSSSLGSSESTSCGMPGWLHGPLAPSTTAGASHGAQRPRRPRATHMPS